MSSQGYYPVESKSDSDTWSIRQAEPIWNVKLWTNAQNGAKLTFKKQNANFNFDR